MCEIQYKSLLDHCWVSMLYGKKVSEKFMPTHGSTDVPWSWLRAAMQGFVSQDEQPQRTEMTHFVISWPVCKALLCDAAFLFLDMHTTMLTRDLRVSCLSCPGSGFGRDFFLIKTSVFCMMVLQISQFTFKSKVSLKMPVLSCLLAASPSAAVPPHCFRLPWGQILL